MSADQLAFAVAGVMFVIGAVALFYFLWESHK